MKANPVFSLYIPTKLVFVPELPCGNMGIWKEYSPN